MDTPFKYPHLEGGLVAFNPLDGVDISIPHIVGVTRAFHLATPKTYPVRSGDFIGSVELGGSCNCATLEITPHGSGTHTEGVGHIALDAGDIGLRVEDAFFLSLLVTTTPSRTQSGDQVITPEDLNIEQLNRLPPSPRPIGLIIRTLPNPPSKPASNYSGTNPPYLSASAAKIIANSGIRHLIVDLPSLDRESDGGKLAAHRHILEGRDKSTPATVTELVYIPDSVRDGLYFTNLQVPPVPGDAVPSRVVIYPTKNA